MKVYDEAEGVAMEQKYWLLIKPPHKYEFGDGDEDVLWNGLGQVGYEMPGVDCPECKLWKTSLISTLQVPRRAEKDRRLKQGGYIPLAKYKQLMRDLQKEYGDMDISRLLEPGMCFSPFTVTFPERPVMEFMHPASGRILVQERVRDCFIAAGITGVAWRPVDAELYGWYDEKTKEVRPWDRRDRLSPEGRKKTKSERLDGLSILYSDVICIPENYIFYELCKTCGHQNCNLRDVKDRLEDRRPPWRLSASNLPQTDVFMLFNDGGVCVNNKVRRLIEDNSMKNIGFEEVLVEEGPSLNSNVIWTAGPFFNREWAP